MSGTAMDLNGEFENLIAQAGARGAWRLGVSITDRRIDGRCSHWPFARVVTISQGAVDAGADVARAVLAHEVAHARQAGRWLIPVGTWLLLAAQWTPLPTLSPSGAIVAACLWLLVSYHLYEVDADRWAARQVGAENLARVLDRLGFGVGWRAWILRRRARLAGA